MARILALDIGEKRIGVAVSDALNVIAQGLETIERRDIEDVLNKIKSLAETHNVAKIIVGMPFNMDGSKGKSARLSEQFAALLKSRVPVSVETIDERLSTSQGERMLLQADLSRKKRKASIDKIAAQLILQTYLDLHVQKNKPQ